MCVCEKCVRRWLAFVSLLAASAMSFQPNDCDMDAHGLHLLTGPNMGGKSTYLRQVALLVIMAQVRACGPVCLRVASVGGFSDDGDRAPHRWAALFRHVK